MYEHHSKDGTNTATTPKHKVNDVLMEIDKGGIGLGNICTKCEAKCPDEIVGLHILHNGGI
jgi:hypothetical protein